MVKVKVIDASGGKEHEFEVKKSGNYNFYL
jgi:hypothetical protein